MTDMIPAWVEGVLTPVEKLAAHQQGLRHKAVSVFVICGREILIQQRALNKYHTPGLWANTCCTHPLWGEDSLTCATRRLREELGIEGVAPIYRDQIEYRADVGNGMVEHEVVDLFLVEVAEYIPLVLNPEEVRDTDWIDAEQLRADIVREPERFTPWLRIYLQEHSARIFCN